MYAPLPCSNVGGIEQLAVNVFLTASLMSGRSQASSGKEEHTKLGSVNFEEGHYKGNATKGTLI